MLANGFLLHYFTKIGRSLQWECTSQSSSVTKDLHVVVKNESMDAFLFVCILVFYVILYTKVLRSNIMVHVKNLIGAVGAFGCILSDCFVYCSSPSLVFWIATLVAFLRSPGLGDEKKALAVGEIIGILRHGSRG